MERHLWRKVDNVIRSTSRPCPRWGHTCCVIGDEVVFFGGYAGTSSSIQIRTTWTMSGPTTQSPWNGKKSSLKETNLPTDPTAQWTTTKKTTKSSFSEEEAPTNKDLTPSASLTGNQKNGSKSTLARMKQHLGKEPITLHNSNSPTLSSMEEREWPTLKIFGSSIFKPSAGRKSHSLKTQSSLALADSILLHWLATKCSLLPDAMENTDVWVISTHLTWLPFSQLEKLTGSNGGRERWRAIPSWPDGATAQLPLKTKSTFSVVDSATTSTIS